MVDVVCFDFGDVPLGLGDVMGELIHDDLLEGQEFGLVLEHIVGFLGEGQDALQLGDACWEVKMTVLEPFEGFDDDFSLDSFEELQA